MVLWGGPPTATRHGFVGLPAITSLDLGVWVRQVHRHSIAVAPRVLHPRSGIVTDGVMDDNAFH